MLGLFDNIKSFKNKIDKIEATVYSGKLSLLEVYEINAKLEREIAARTKELDRANKQMLTLHHIWEMMNSSKPLSSVLNAIVNSLQGELGYLYSVIMKSNQENKLNQWQIVASSREDLDNKFSEVFSSSILDFTLQAPNIAAITNAIQNNQIYQSENMVELISSLIPELEADKVENFITLSGIKSYILVPLTSQQKHFGSLFVFSSRRNVSESELNFLRLFAKQIELAITIADLFQAVKEQAITDGMTGLYNRRYFEEYIKKEAIRADRQAQKFTVIGLDLDHLKNINDTYGHNYGDIAIKAIADILKKNARAIDVPARIGGEEFNILLPGVDSEGGYKAAERIRQAIETIELDKIGHITASLGVATYFEHTKDVYELLEIADRAMYESKLNGRNRVTIAKDVSETSWQEIAINAYIEILSKHKIPLDETTTQFLKNKLEEMNINNDKLYMVADTLVNTYNPEHTAGGVKQKVELAALLAKRFDLSKDNIDKLKIAVLLYDIGNTMLPKELLQKRSPLSKDDMSSIKQHPIIAAREILQPISDVVDVIPIIEKHHENWNGTGYPAKISGDDIPIESQIILIVDSYFALMEKRPYRDAMSKEDALIQIEQEINQKWSEKLAKEFIAIVANEQ